MWKKRPQGKDDRPLKTLDRVLSLAGLCSRTEARSWIGRARVSVNGKLIQTPDHWVDLKLHTVSVDGKPIQARKRRYLLLYKPTGYLTTYKDPQNRPTVYDLLGDIPDFVSPVGRFDLDTSGLLILTNDALLAERLTNPAYKVPKTYLVKAAGALTEEQLDQLRRGVQLHDGPTQPAEVVRVRGNDKSTFLELTIREGRNRQVRRMLEAVGSRVRKLVRIAIGPLRIGELEIGKYRALTTVELDALWEQSGGRPASQLPVKKQTPAPVRKRRSETKPPPRRKR